MATDEGDAGDRKSRKIILVEEFDDIPGIDAVTLAGNQVQVSGNQLSITGWRLPSFLTHRPIPRGSNHRNSGRRQSEEDGISHYLPKGARLFLPSDDLKNLEKVNGKRGSDGIKNSESVLGSNANVYMYDDSIWTFNPDEPLLEETSYQYDRWRKIFSAFFAITVILLALILLCGYTFVFQYGGGILEDPSVSSNETRRQEDRAEKSYNIHTLVVMSLLFHFENILIFRIFPRVSKFRLKCIHASTAFIGALGVVVSLVFAIRGHAVKGEDYFTTLHGCIGIMSMVLYEVQFLFGFSIFLLPYASLMVRGRFISVHKFFGSMTFLTSVTSFVTGVVVITKIFIPVEVHAKLPVQSVLLNSLGIFTVVYAMLMTFLTTDHRFRRRPRPELHLAVDANRTEESQQGGESNLGGQSGSGDMVDLNTAQGQDITSST